MASNLKLIISGISHLRFQKLNREMIGYKEERILDPFYIEDIKDYAAATGDNPTLYNEDSVIPPLFVSRLIHPALIETILKPELKMNILKMVHGELEIKWFLPVYVKDTLRLSMELREILDTKAGELLKISFLIKRSEEIVAEAIAGLLIRSPMGEKSQKEEESREVLFSTGIKTSPDQALRYAKASLDNNLIHTSPFFARLVGLKRPILHGVCLFAMVCNALLTQFADGDKKRLVSMSGRFAYPVYPGESIKLNCFKGTSDRIIEFEVINSAGKKNIKLGRFEYS